VDRPSARRPASLVAPSGLSKADIAGSHPEPVQGVVVVRPAISDLLDTVYDISHHELSRLREKARKEELTPQERNALKIHVEAITKASKEEREALEALNAAREGLTDDELRQMGGGE
jgi:hypothetical protein